MHGQIEDGEWIYGQFRNGAFEHVGNVIISSMMIVD